MVWSEVNGASNISPHHEKQDRNKNVVFNIEGVEIVEAGGEHGACAGGAVTLWFWVLCKTVKNVGKHMSYREIVQ